MNPQKIIWHIFPATLCILIFAIATATWYSTDTIENYFLQEAKKDLQARNHLVDTSIQEILKNEKIEELQQFVLMAGRESGTRITIVNIRGKVLADSNESPKMMNNHGNRPEIIAAFKEGSGSAIRHSATLNNILLYNAISSKYNNPNDNQDALIIRTSISVSSLYKTISDIKKRVAIGALVISFIAGFVILVISRNISRPLENLAEWARNFSKGEFQGKQAPNNYRNASLEVINLTKTMAQMGTALDDKITSINGHRQQLQTVFSSMQESIIAIDAEGYIVAINQSAKSIFQLGKMENEGRLIEECIRNLDLLEQVKYVRENQESLNSELELAMNGKTIYLQSNIVPLDKPEINSQGTLIVLNNITRIRQLESVRKDFVANVSHELRTPITAIQGYVETLLDGAIENKENAENFLQIILRQSSRLSAIINDLLVLAKIEQDAEGGNIELYEMPLHLVLGASIQTCELEAQKKELNLILDCSPDINISLNAALLEQAINNLVVNAIQYSKNGDSISICANHTAEKTVQISVIDNGCGIQKIHHPRLFERFYRSDPARSRSQGGTGLGLAITKHIINSHGGSIEVESEENKGCKFLITLPA
ncbi:MAG: cell wall metabolism sensor histidine kinase WalK [Desulfotalea sp.]